MSILLLLQPPSGPQVTPGPATSGPLNLLTLVRGDDYFNADGRALRWVTTDPQQWPGLTGATVSFVIRDGNEIVMEHAAAVSTPSGPAKAVRVDLDSATTDALPLGWFSYGLQAVLSNGHNANLARGPVQVLRDYQP